MHSCRGERSRARGSRRKRRTRALLASQAIQCPLQLRCPSGGVVCEAARPWTGPERSSLPAGLLIAFAVAGIYPVPLRLSETVFELRASGFPTLRKKFLVGPVQVCIVRYYGAIQAGALVDRRGRVARVSGSR